MAHMCAHTDPGRPPPEDPAVGVGLQLYGRVPHPLPLCFQGHAAASLDQSGCLFRHCLWTGPQPVHVWVLGTQHRALQRPGCCDRWWKPWKPDRGGMEGRIGGRTADRWTHMPWSGRDTEQVSALPWTLHVLPFCLLPLFTHLSESPGVWLQEPEGRCRACAL